MELNKSNNLFPNLSRMAVLSFAVSLLICSFMVGAVIIGRTHNEALQKEQFISEKSRQIEDTLSRLFYKTEVLAALVRHGDGYIHDFAGIAALIVDDPAILNILIAPGGVVTSAFSPHEDVSALIGHNFFDDLSGNIEAMLAIEAGELVMAGPFMARQGRIVLAGRLPVYLDAEKTDFWGLVSVTLKFPEALDNAELERLRVQGYEYELWRVNPDTNEKQVLDSNITTANPNARYVEEHFQVMNADWYLRLLATRTWYHYPEVIILIFAGIFISFLVLFIAQNNHKLRQTRAELAVLAKSDPLTGIYNRRHFSELAQLDIERAQRFNETSFVILIDADYFKKVNDTHGHLVGDKVLIEFAKRIKETIRPYNLLARYGGEEFIIYMPNSNKEGVDAATERIRLKICTQPFVFSDISLNLSASIGVAIIGNDGIEKAIKHADDALYLAKKEGRNRVVFH
jgi:diguanylate cyclase (GGDEF)-like protein